MNNINPTGCNQSQWLNPRRKLHAETVLAHLWWHAGKIRLDRYHYLALRDEHQLQPHQVDGAVDDLYAIGAADVRAPGGGIVIVQALARSVEECLFAPGAAEPDLKRTAKANGWRMPRRFTA